MGDRLSAYDEPERTRRVFVREWARVEVYAGDMTFSDYMKAIQALQAVTNQVDRTNVIFMAVVRQASELGRSLAWVQAELRFEAEAELAGHRAHYLRLAVSAQEASDDSLDLYNERFTRFADGH